VTARVCSSSPARGGGFLTHVRLDRVHEAGEYPFSLPVVQHLVRAGGLALTPGVTFLVGDNG
jgi:predicted ATPase